MILFYVIIKKKYIKKMVFIMKNKKLLFMQIVLLIIYLSMLAFFMYECFKTGEEASKQAAGVANVVADVQSAITQKPVVVDNNYKVLVSKLVGHYAYFCILGLVSILFYMTFKRLKPIFRIILHFGIGFIFALITEFVAEAITKGRNASIVDVFIDFGGLATISMIYIIIYYILRYKNNKKEIIKNDN